MEKILPQNNQAEEATIGAMLLEKDAITIAVGILKTEDFLLEKHQNIFSVIKDLYNKNIPVDLIICSAEIKKRAIEIEVQYLCELMAKAPTAASIEYYGNLVREASVRRKLIKIGSEITDAAFDETLETEELVDCCEQKVYNVVERKVVGFNSLYDLAKQQYNIIDDAITNGIENDGLMTGFTGLNDITGGFRKKELIIIAARPSMGKTAIMLNLARTISKSKKSVALFSLEMSKEVLAQRLLCCEAMMRQEDIKMKNLTQVELVQLGQAVENINGQKLYLDDDAVLSVSDIRAKCRRLKSEFGLDCIIIDYLQLMHEPHRNSNRVEEISAISRGLKRLARELDVPVIALSQLSRKVEERSPRRPMLSDLRESGSIEQDADIVMLLYRPIYYGENELKAAGYSDNDTNIAELIVAKQRNGDVGTIKLKWNSSMGLFVNRGW